MVEDNDSPFYNKSFNDAYHVVFINIPDTIKYILYDMKNDVDKNIKYFHPLINIIFILIIFINLLNIS